MSRVKILWVKTDPLFPLNKGGRIRSYNMLAAMARKIDVDYLCYATMDSIDDHFEKMNEMFHRFITVPRNHEETIGWNYLKKLAIAHLKRKPFTLYNYYLPIFKKKLQDIVINTQYDAIVCDFLAPALNFNRVLRKRATLFQHNVEHVLWERQYKQEKRKLRKIVYEREYRLLKRYEKALCRDFKRVVCVSDQDAEALRKRCDLDNVSSVKTGVDVDYFEPQPEKALPARLVFTGSMDWLPNIDGITWFVQEVLPIIRQTFPNAKLSIVGRSPTPVVIKLARRHSGIIVTGEIPDVRPWMAQGEVFVVPIRVGGGTRLKIYEAMAMGLPIVSTTVGAEGLDYQKGKDIIIADGAKPFANAVVALLEERDMRFSLGDAARRFVVDNFSWPCITEQFLSIILDQK